MPTGRLRGLQKQKVIKKPSNFCLKIVAAESEFYYPDEYEFLDNGDLTETNNERVGDRENEGNSQEEIETFVKEQKSENTTKKTVNRYLSSISKGDKEILNLPADDILHFPRGC